MKARISTPAKKVALFCRLPGPEQEAKLRRALAGCGYTVKNISAMADQYVGALVGAPGYAIPRRSPVVTLPEGRPVLLFGGVTPPELDPALLALREAGLDIPLKAVVTSANIGWQLRQLVEELEKENAAIEGGA